MFRYLISPEGSNQYSHISAITVTPEAKDTITNYVQNITRTQVGPVDVSAHLDYCFNSYFAHYRHHNYTFVHFDDPRHDRMHSADTDEINNDHIHFQLDHDISSVDMENFLRALRRCQSMARLSDNYEFFTAEVVEDIVNKFKDYQQQDNHTEIFAASNSPAYNQLYRTNQTMPTISEHSFCLLNASSSCTPANPLTPERYRFTYKAIAEQEQAVLTNTVSASILGIAALGLFALKRCRRSNMASVEPVEPTLEQKVKTSLARLT